VLLHAAEFLGKRVGGLESYSAQLGMLSQIPARSPAPGQSPNLPETRATMNDLSLVLSEMQAAWNRGDWRLFGMLVADMRVTSPGSYTLVFAQRNANWASWIAGRLQRPGTVFVAVGTGHLVGRDSIQAKLALRGFRSARIN
jgi:uncharacterized protein YbaP (TraB family)